MQREKLSALMDGEALDSEVVHLISEDAVMQKQWERYHLVRDVLRGDVGDVLHLDIASQVALALEKEPVHINPVHTNPAAVLESQPKPETWANMPFWGKIRTWKSQIAQIGVAACVSLAVIVGVQQHNRDSSVETDNQFEAPAFNTLPVMGTASTVGLMAPAEEETFGGDLSTKVRESNKRIDAMLQQYEFARRIHGEKHDGVTQVNPVLGAQAAQQSQQQ
ncbi:anti-sigma-E factor RseA [Xenorhabdus sp. IM139775]|uniref:anti-sigma-E factor RseA n=1 Tax=Xenorhabdus sp. IM139775 TaxID=3025876 RepID=UPI0023587E23|nr:anti-sigma-E factor RseA [Xenorhabdus sp. IM139775]MDC9594577.1 anti-sigma-E factor RseA [Xenorhabdus sp. IM139775]